MKAIYKMIIFFIAILITNHLVAQPALTNNIIKQTQGINGILRATTNANSNANSNAKIHANSNSVFGTGKTPPDYNKKDQNEKGEMKAEREMKKNNKGKKQKK